MLIRYGIAAALLGGTIVYLIFGTHKFEALLVSILVIIACRYLVIKNEHLRPGSQKHDR